MGFASVWLIASTVSVSAIAGDFFFANNADATHFRRRVRACQFLTHATFGPTVDQVDALADRMRQIGVRDAINEWIDDQWSQPATFHAPIAVAMTEEDQIYTRYERNTAGTRYGEYPWWHVAIAGEDQLRQRTAWALGQILVLNRDEFRNVREGNITGHPTWIGPVVFYDLLIQHAGGNYRDLLQDVTYNPAMGRFLTYLRNRRGGPNHFPDENYARELMQLFTIGVHQLDRTGRRVIDAAGQPIETYDNRTITELARVMTGLTFQPVEGGNPWISGRDYAVPMVMHQPRHDDGIKQPFEDLTLTSGDGEQDIREVLDYLFEHDNIAPFICYRLIQRLVRANPSRGYIRRVVAKFEDNGRGVRGDLAEVVRAILTDSEAFRGLSITYHREPLRIRVAHRHARYGRLREPIVRYLGLLRSMRPTSHYPSGRYMIPSTMANFLGQGPHRAPSVFGFFDYDHRPGGFDDFDNTRGVLATSYMAGPEFKIHSPGLVARWFNDVMRMIEEGQNLVVQNPVPVNGEWGFEYVMSFDWTRERGILAGEGGLEALIDELDLLHCRGVTPTAVKQRYVREIQTAFPEPSSSRDERPDGDGSSSLNASGDGSAGDDPLTDGSDWMESQLKAAYIAILTSPYCATEF